MHGNDFLRKGTIGTILGAGGQNNGKVEDLSEGRVGQEVVAVFGWRLIADKVEEANLDINNQKRGILHVETVIRKLAGYRRVSRMILKP